MSRLFYHVCQDNAGNLLFDVSGTMRLAGSGTLATIYGDEALTVVLPNPMTNHPSYGSFKCFLGAGDYDFYMAKSGYSFETLTGVQGHGTMAQQDASNVAITGGQATLDIVTAGAVTANGLAGNDISAFYSPMNDVGGTGRRAINVVGTAKSYFGAPIGIQTQPAGAAALFIAYTKNSQSAVTLKPTDADAGALNSMAFLNVAGSVVGSINTTGSATAFNTTSDARLKTAVQNLVGELAVIRALRPVRFRWLADDSEGVGFLAGEVQEQVHGVITGEPDAVEEDGVTIRPQQIDLSKLVPWLVGAVQTLAARVETLTERVAELEAG